MFVKIIDEDLTVLEQSNRRLSCIDYENFVIREAIKIGVRSESSQCRHGK